MDFLHMVKDHITNPLRKLQKVGIEPEVELILPAEVEARARQRIVAQLRGRALFPPIFC